MDLSVTPPAIANDPRANLQAPGTMKWTLLVTQWVACATDIWFELNHVPSKLCSLPYNTDVPYDNHGPLEVLVFRVIVNNKASCCMLHVRGHNILNRRSDNGK